MVKYVTKVIMV